MITSETCQYVLSIIINHYQFFYIFHIRYVLDRRIVRLDYKDQTIHSVGVVRQHVSFQFLLVLELNSTVEAVLGEARPLMHLEAALREEPFPTVEAGELKLLTTLLLMGLGQVIMVISYVHL